jgi:hypothetical protein
VFRFVLTENKPANRGASKRRRKLCFASAGACENDGEQEVVEAIIHHCNVVLIRMYANTSSAQPCVYFIMQSVIIILFVCTAVNYNVKAKKKEIVKGDCEMFRQYLEYNHASQAI